jgi:hypothetical protein
MREKLTELGRVIPSILPLPYPPAHLLQESTVLFFQSLHKVMPLLILHRWVLRQETRVGEMETGTPPGMHYRFFLYSLLALGDLGVHEEEGG